jgi:flavin-dependent dehydrogenase
MKQSSAQYDVAIVGASIAGSTAAILYAQRGLRVALIERNPDIDAYKKVCTHFIQPTALPTLKRIGIDRAIEAAGGIRNSIDVWTAAGWVRPKNDDRFYGYNIRRQVLDPLLRRQAADNPNVDFMPGTSLRELVFDQSRVVGLRAERERQPIEIRARLVIGADGRNSRTAALAGLPADTTPNNRFVYFAQYRNLSLTSGQRSQMWLLGTRAAYAMPNDEGITVVGVMFPKDELAAFKQDLEGNFTRFVESLPDGPKLREAERVSDIMGMVDMPNISRTKIGPGIALIGDAALASDPLWGIGCGWAFQSAQWLVDATFKSLRRGAVELEQALERYRERHHKTLADRYARIADFSSGRSLNLVERLLYGAAVHDPGMARYTGPYFVKPDGLRNLPPARVLARALWLNVSRQAQSLAGLPVRQSRQIPAPPVARRRQRTNSAILLRANS